eukprot:6540581-Alexandrium_andersonii.AAC.1
MSASLVGSEMCIRDRCLQQVSVAEAGSSLRKASSMAPKAILKRPSAPLVVSSMGKPKAKIAIISAKKLAKASKKIGIDKAGASSSSSGQLVEQKPPAMDLEATHWQSECAVV